jgi:hypothetical protein
MIDMSALFSMQAGAHISRSPGVCERGGWRPGSYSEGYSPQETAATIASLSTSLKPETDRRRVRNDVSLPESIPSFRLCRLQTLQPEENLDLGLARTVTLRQ